MILPTTKTVPTVSLSSFTTLVYGKPKIGKSTFAAGFPDAVFLDCEGGLQSLETFRVSIFTWVDFVGACSELAKGEHPFKTVIIDTVDQAFQRCREHVLGRLGIRHESDADIGKGWDLVTNEFARTLASLALLPYGLVLISHAQEKEFKTRTGKQIKQVPTLPGRTGRIVLGMADIVLYADHEVSEAVKGVQTETRVLRTKPTNYYDAGDRTGFLPESIPLDFQTFADTFATAAKLKLEEQRAGNTARSAPASATTERSTAESSATEPETAAVA